MQQSTLDTGQSVSVNGNVVCALYIFYRNLCCYFIELNVYSKLTVLG